MSTKRNKIIRYLKGTILGALLGFFIGIIVTFPVLWIYCFAIDNVEDCHWIMSGFFIRAFILGIVGMLMGTAIGLNMAGTGKFYSRGLIVGFVIGGVCFAFVGYFAHKLNIGPIIIRLYSLPTITVTGCITGMYIGLLYELITTRRTK